ncbi:LOW QUALITY PROTEIN: hypothetical protein Cgig2_007089 [Carnegiea gigantea]|uniref:Aminotransferase-like plant mobile domain-containing protein n=1 Tax=Carnegiea gigantea TaxID=171969 RepID=A0A9Q1JSE5_9CARY|nr:LOW QUALITY PROTEIN: hypothetical protein Cgig2_007089 [Carnegiea gigantea]
MAKLGLATEREGNSRESRDNGRSGQKKKGAAFNGGKMVLCSGRKRVHSAGSPKTSGRTGEESDPKYRSGDEGGSSTMIRSRLQVRSSSNNHFKGEMQSKKRHHLRREGQRVVGHRKGFIVKGKGKGKVEEVKRRSTNDKREDAGRQQAVDVDIRHRCVLDAICAMNDQLSDIQKEAIRGMVWSLVLEYRTFLMERHLVHALLQAWNPESKCFKLGRREVPFSDFDVALLTGFPATRMHVAFERSDGGSEVEEVLKRAMEEHVCTERQRRRTAQKDMCIYKNYVLVLLELCRVNNTVERVALFNKLYTFSVLSGLLFPRCAGGNLVHIVEDVDGVREYNWAKVVWEFLVHAVEESQEKMWSMKNMQINGFAMIL